MSAYTSTSASALPGRERGGWPAAAVPFFRNFALVPALVAAVVVGAVLNDRFLTARNLINVLQQSSELAVVVVALSLVLLVGRIDLSLESTFGLSAMVAALLVVPAATGGYGVELNPVLGILVALGVGVAFGAVNGGLIVYLKLNAFVATLAMMILLRGLVLGVGSGKTVFGLPDVILWLGSGSVLGIPVSVYIAGILFLSVGVFLRYHRIGRAIYAIGGNPDAARAAGIRVQRVLFGIFVFGGAMAALAGLMQAGRLGAVTAVQGQNLIFTAVAASVIGGISLNGGRGSMFGALTGVLTLGVVSNVLTLSQVPSFWIDAAYGVIILVALIMSRLTSGEGQTM
ncbi:ABC transporter permease [Micromonospora sp. NPDC048830]|uniref:ABC transporter permease n=1 Tax=Micromonospora sp. NPDC048830 TaxID=3364257 RepID=UPI0037231AA3